MTTDILSKRVPHDSKLQCNGCGECCRRIVFKIQLSTAPQVQYYKARGFEVTRDKLLIARIPNVCPHLTEDNRCGIEKDKPLLCRLYPHGLKKSELHEDCEWRKD